MTDLKSSGLLEGKISNGLVFRAIVIPIAMVQSFENRTIQIRTFMSCFQMVFDKMMAICPDFKWLGFWISDPI